MAKTNVKGVYQTKAQPCEPKKREASYDFVTNKSSLTSPKWDIFLDTVRLLGIPQSNSHHSDVATAIWS
jgi:hypothetical protein